MDIKSNSTIIGIARDRANFYWYIIASFINIVSRSIGGWLWDVIGKITPELMLTFFYTSMMPLSTYLLATEQRFTLTWFDEQVWLGIQMHWQYMIVAMGIGQIALITSRRAGVYALCSIPMLFYCLVLILGIRS